PGQDGAAGVVVHALSAGQILAGATFAAGLEPGGGNVALVELVARSLAVLASAAGCGEDGTDDQNAANHGTPHLFPPSREHRGWSEIAKKCAARWNRVAVCKTRRRDARPSPARTTFAVRLRRRLDELLQLVGREALFETQSLISRCDTVGRGNH